MLNLLDYLLGVAISILEHELDLLIIFYMFSDVTKVDELCLTIHIGLLILEFEHFDP